MTPGCGSDCPCQQRGWSDEDRTRPIFSTGVRYTMEQGEDGLFRYRYLAAATS